MSEPIAWRVDMGGHGWCLFDNLEDARENCDAAEPPEPIYPGAEIERKDAAIAELVTALKLSASIIGHPDDAHSKLINDVIAKYDNS